MVYSGEFHKVPKGLPGFLSTKLLPFRARITLLRMMAKILRLNPEDVVDITVHDFIKGFTEREDIYRLVSALIGSGIVCPDMEGDAAKGVVVNDEFVEAKTVVAAFPLQRIFDILDKSLLPESFVETVEGIEPTSGISIDLALNGKVSSIESLIITLNPVIMGHFTSNLYPDVAPEGKQLATFYYPLPYEKMENRGYLSKRLNEMKEIFEEMFPGIFDKLEWERVLYLKVVDGAIPKPVFCWRHNKG